MDILDLTVIIFFLIVPLGIAGTIVPLLFEKATSSLANLLTFGLITAVVIFVSMLMIYVGHSISPVIPGFPYSAITLPVIVVFWGIIIRSSIARFLLRPEQIIVDLGRAGYKPIALLGIIPFMSAIYIIFLYSVHGTSAVSYLLVALYLSQVPFFLATAFSKIYITRTGFFRFIGPINWSDIQGYRWYKHGEKEVKLILKTSLDIGFRISIDQYQLVDDILQAHDIGRLPSRTTKRMVGGVDG